MKKKTFFFRLAAALNPKVSAMDRLAEEMRQRMLHSPRNEPGMAAQLETVANDLNRLRREHLELCARVNELKAKNKCCVLQ
jgi:HAMP domain-containing protein